MSEFSPAGTVPAGLPMLSRGDHRNPTRGACFMEYTSLLAGEPFTDHPRCVDAELAAVLRAANDRLSDAERSLLVPLLGRAVGLAVEPPPPGSTWRGPAPVRRLRREQVARYREQTGQLRRAVSERFLAVLGAPASPVTQVWSGGGEELSWLFWDLMDEPAMRAHPSDFARRLVDRLRLLHECYEQAMDGLGLPRSTPVPSEPAAQRTPVTT
jgi:hypothetical protein